MTVPSCVLMIVAEPDSPGERPIPITRVDDAGLVRRAAMIAIAEQDRHAAEVQRADAVLGAMEAAEALRLRSVLEALVPDLVQPAGVIQ